MSPTADQPCPRPASSVKAWVPVANHRTSPLPAEEWEKVKPILQRLREAKMSVNNIVTHMKDEHGFIAKKDQYNKKFGDWGWVKPQRGKPANVVVKQTVSPPDGKDNGAAATEASHAPLPSPQGFKGSQAPSRGHPNRTAYGISDRGYGGRVFTLKAVSVPPKRQRVPTCGPTSGNTTPDTHSPTRSSTRSHSQGPDDGNTTPPSLISDTETTYSRSHKRARIEPQDDEQSNHSSMDHGAVPPAEEGDQRLDPSVMLSYMDSNVTGQLRPWSPDTNMTISDPESPADNLDFNEAKVLMDQYDSQEISDVDFDDVFDLIKSRQSQGDLVERLMKGQLDSEHKTPDGNAMETD
ncbi:hypothetical protein MKZ38_008495 [Zalerion maritima]|uniref:Clr5 domain-containing protein n=1 Tax=Zalerion maritima TaxID=339359 RepID=A0AAD5RHJ1_9PEZI|nr:hypothetical protein MKZ38_008495 [Zalerion maritima]